MRSAFVFLALLPACLNPETGDDTGDTSDTNVAGGATIRQIQTGAIEEDATVTLKAVVVTSNITVKGDGFFVQDAGGGEYSGMYVYIPSGIEETYLEPGYTLNITGSVTEFYDWTEFSVSSETAIEVTGEGSTVTVDTVDPAAVESWEAWESCLISVGSAVVSEGMNDHNEAVLDNGLKIDDLLWAFDVEAGSSFTNVTGALGYSFEEWKLFPRDEADLAGYVAPVIEPASISDVQQGNATGTVILENVVVTSPMTIKDGVNNGFYVQTQGGGEWSGIFVYRKDGFGSYVAELGDVLTLQGGIAEFYDATQIVVKDIENLTDSETTASVTATPVNASTVSDWEIWESCLVDLGVVGVTSDVDGHGEVQTTAGINIDNLFFQFQAQSGSNYGLTGILGYAFENFKVFPRNEGDLVAVTSLD
jgi:predicted extracellular nuclease